MEKKKFYLVTETMVNFKRMSVDTFIKGISEELDNAHSILSISEMTIIENGFDRYLISDFESSWVYKSDCCIIKDEIIIIYV